MQINGQKIELTNVKILPIIRDSGTIFLKVAPISSFDDFLKVCPMPEPPMRELPGKGLTPWLEEKNFQKQLALRNTQMLQYMIIKSLEATENLIWDTVDMSNPDTYVNYESELRDSGFTQIEITRVVNAVMQVNSLDESAIDEARERFLASKTVEPVPV